MERRYLNINELSEYIGIPKGTLYVWACQKRIPYAKIGGLLRFDHGTLTIGLAPEEWLNLFDYPFNHR